MKITTVVGARPQFIKAAMLTRVLRNDHEEILIHTGQHYDANMSDIFFEEMNIPKPDINLGISGGSHGKMTAAMLAALEDVFTDIHPDTVLVYGDTNSTLAASLAAAKLNIPICHVEAGPRTHDMSNPEEVNRVLTDRMSSLLMAPTENSVKELQREGITRGVHLTGDLMYDATLFYHSRLHNIPLDFISLGGKKFTPPQKFYYLTCHRQENTYSDEPLTEIFTAMESLDAPTIYPVHPRNQKRALYLHQNFKNIILAEPVGYLTSLWLLSNAEKVVTDSGGLQREAFFLNKQCVSVINFAVWPETMVGDINQICPPKADEIISKLENKPNFSAKMGAFGFGDGNSAAKIASVLKDL
jgi:UDP-N-acetylglucosamine 2-epimerase (non-hydrolysing)/UDP-GlcNAc3NAcA epimerase